MTHCRAWSFYLAPILIGIATINAADSDHVLKPLYIDNGALRLGVDLSSGGSVFFLSESTTKRNLLNHYDRGRFIQQSYYGDEDGSIWNGKPWRWNPVQGGDWRGKPARVLEQKHDADSLFIKSVPVNWAGGQDITDVALTQTVQLKSQVAHIHYTMTYAGKNTHQPRHQELPAVFVDYALPNLVMYTGDQPWTRAELTRVVPGWPNQTQHADERWAAYVDDHDWGIGVYFPDSSKELTTYRFEGATGPTGSGCSYFAPVRTLGITPGLHFTYDVYLTIGRLDDIHTRFDVIRRTLSVPTP